MKQEKEILRNGNSKADQRVKDKLVRREILACFTYEFGLLLKQGWENSKEYPCYDEIENFYSYPAYRGQYYNFNGGGEEDKEDTLEEIKNRLDIFKAMTDDAQDWGEEGKVERLLSIVEDLQSDYDAIEELESEPAEIFEWWAVSNFFAEKLRECGECIIDFGCNHYWGRQTTGQAILLDAVITKIAFDMEILEGQKNHTFWKD